MFVAQCLTTSATELQPVTTEVSESAENARIMSRLATMSAVYLKINILICFSGYGFTSSSTSLSWFAEHFGFRKRFFKLRFELE